MSIHLPEGDFTPSPEGGGCIQTFIPLLVILLIFSVFAGPESTTGRILFTIVASVFNLVLLSILITVLKSLFSK
jgi:hypothetical protein